ncbi:MAG: phosphoadenosine phosphosulfate reductase family protein [Desulfotomaculales bacterium]
MGRLKEESRLYAKLAVFKNRVEKAKEIIRKALADVPGTWALSFSGGKDSTALFYLCLEVGWRGPVLHFYFPETPEENTAFVETLTEKHGLELHLLQVPGAWDVYTETKSFFVTPNTPEEEAAKKKMLKDYKRVINSYIDAQLWSGQFLGMRKNESKTREIALKSKGFLYRTRDRKTWTCCPLYNWEARDVWAFIFSRNIPYLHCYDKATGPEKERSEIVWLACERAWSNGQIAWLKKERPDEFRRLMFIWPDLQKYV